MIRTATLNDKPRLVEMTTRFIETTAYNTWLSSSTQKRIDALVDRVLELGIIFVAEASHRCAFLCPGCTAPCPTHQRVVGMLALLIYEHPLTGTKCAEEAAWWVEPEHRAGSLGPRLLTYMERWCVQNRLHMVKMVAPTESVGSFYQKHGYQALETHWIKVL